MRTPWDGAVLAPIPAPEGARPGPPEALLPQVLPWAGFMARSMANPSKMGIWPLLATLLAPPGQELPSGRTQRTQTPFLFSLQNGAAATSPSAPSRARARLQLLQLGGSSRAWHPKAEHNSGTRPEPAADCKPLVPQGPQPLSRSRDALAMPVPSTAATLGTKGTPGAAMPGSSTALPAWLGGCGGVLAQLPAWPLLGAGHRRGRQRGRAVGSELEVTQALALLPGCIFAAGKHYAPQRLLFFKLLPLPALYPSLPPPPLLQESVVAIIIIIILIIISFL